MTKCRNDLTRHLGTADIFCPGWNAGARDRKHLRGVCSGSLLPHVLSPPLPPLLHAFILLVPLPLTPPPLLRLLPALDPPPLGQRAERGGQGAMVTHSRRNPPAMSSVPPPGARGQGSEMPPQRYKPFSSHAHYQQVLCALRKLQESGFYWGAVGGREASSLLRSQPPGTFLVRDSSDHHYFFTLSVQTTCGTKNLRIHSQGGSFYLQPDPRCTHTPPRFDCVLKLIGHYMGKEGAGGEVEAGALGRTGGGTPGAEGESVGTGSVYLIHSGGEKVPLELSRPLPSSLSSLQHLCRRTLNGHPGLADPHDAHQLPHTLRDFLEEYDAAI
ncbi:hypothetical protein DPEC_G00032440 [Dallia pectoralis]|uniref:Uncharacterized protein n=1 Tax=Dallia pectoralis TaxID=75939 RepID=A0ACC2HCG0_DALPE|nr:hypothetical protein DPEC_G00032440 [Dallia pectoralis]